MEHSNLFKQSGAENSKRTVAIDEGVSLLQAAILYIENPPQVIYPICVSLKGVAMVSHGKSAMVSATGKSAARRNLTALSGARRTRVRQLDLAQHLAMGGKVNFVRPCVSHV